MALGSQQRTLTVLLLLLLAICLLLFGESLATGFAGLLQLGGDIFGGSSIAVAERQRQRAQHVKEMCAKHPMYKASHWDAWHRALFYDKDTGVMWCKIPKIGSSSWANNFLDLRNVSQKEKDKRLKQPGYLHLLARDMFSSPPEQVWRSTKSLIINRHPFTRLVSLYVAWGKMKDPVNGKNYGIAATLRKPWEKRENRSPAATPDEYLTYILSQLWTKRHSPHKLNEHWVPQWVRCPVCRHTFTTYAQLERLAEDEQFFLHSANIADKVQGGVQINAQLQAKSSCREAEFWAQVSPTIIRNLKASWAYGPDFVLFQYSTTDYWREIKEKCEVQNTRLSK